MDATTPTAATPTATTPTATTSDRAIERETRLTDADREAAVTLLRHAVGEGRLDLDEFEGRLGRAYAARVPSDLDGVLDDLVGPPRPGRTVPATTLAHDRRRRPPAVLGALAVVVVVLLGVLVTPHLFWLLWAAVPLATGGRGCDRLRSDPFRVRPSAGVTEQNAPTLHVRRRGSPGTGGPDPHSRR